MRLPSYICRCPVGSYRSEWYGERYPPLWLIRMASSESGAEQSGAQNNFWGKGLRCSASYLVRHWSGVGEFGVNRSKITTMSSVARGAGSTPRISGAYLVTTTVALCHSFYTI